MIKRVLVIISIMAMTIAIPVTTAFAVAVPVDLSTWLIDGGGSWTFQSNPAPNDTAFQSLNSAPTMLFNNMNSQGLALSGTIEVQETGGDDDFIGFVLGYDDNDLTGSNATTDYILVDWKQGTQSGWNAGMNMSRVTGSIDTCGTCTTSNAWLHNGNVSVLTSATTLGNVGWADNTEYLFDIVFTSTLIQVKVDGVLQFSVNGAFEDGSFGFYNFSQPNVRYAGITEELVIEREQLPEPGTLAIFGLGLAGLGLMRRRKRVA